MNNSLYNGSGLMFDRLAKHYDLLNDLISFGLHRLWRKRLVNLLALQPGDQVLDLATGTGEVIHTILKAYPYQSLQLSGIDTSSQMLARAQAKLGHDPRVHFRLGDAENLPFKDGSFNKLCISFGMRNMPNKEQVLKEIKRVLKANSRIVILESLLPKTGLCKSLTTLYTRYCMPFIGKLSREELAYKYLAHSLEQFMQPSAFKQLLESVPLKKVHFQRLTLGVAYLFYGET